MSGLPGRKFRAILGASLPGVMRNWFRLEETPTTRSSASFRGIVASAFRLPFWRLGSSPGSGDSPHGIIGFQLARRHFALLLLGFAMYCAYRGFGGEETSMDAETLRKTQTPLKERYRSDAKAALVTLKARGEIDDTRIACKVETGRALAIAGLHPATGGTGMELCSGDMLLEALVACAGVTLKAVATALDIPLRSGYVLAEGDLDFRGTLGVAKEAPVGFAAIRLDIFVDSDASHEKLGQLLKLTERYCVVYQTIRGGTRVDIRMSCDKVPTVSASTRGSAA